MRDIQYQILFLFILLPVTGIFFNKYFYETKTQLLMALVCLFAGNADIISRHQGASAQY